MKSQSGILVSPVLVMFGAWNFDPGLERGYGISTWRDSFIAWLKDTGFIKE